MLSEQEADKIFDNQDVTIYFKEHSSIDDIDEFSQIINQVTGCKEYTLDTLSYMIKKLDYTPQELGLSDIIYVCTDDRIINPNKDLNIYFMDEDSALNYFKSTCEKLSQNKTDRPLIMTLYTYNLLTSAGSYDLYRELIFSISITNSVYVLSQDFTNISNIDRNAKNKTVEYLKQVLINEGYNNIRVSTNKR